MFDDHYREIIQFFSTGYATTKFTTTQKKQLFVWDVDFQLIVGKLYKMGHDEILCHCILEHKQPMILNEAHVGVARGHYVGKDTVQKILQAGLWWHTMHADAREYCRSCDICQRTEKSLQRDEMPLVPQITMQTFDKWVVNFLGPISPIGKCTGTRYRIFAIDYLTIWAKGAPIKYCIAVIAANFLFENVVTRFGFLKFFDKRPRHTLCQPFN